MKWSDVALLVFSCVAANHLGLIAAIEEVLGRKLPIMNCVKCLSYWCVFFGTFFSGWRIVEALAISFLSAYVAIWLELGMGFIDVQFGRLYENIYSSTGNDSAADAVDESGAKGIMPDVPEK